MEKSKLVYLMTTAFFLMTVLFGGKTLAQQTSVRLSVTAASGDGLEQQIVDKISSQLGNDPEITLSTLNPDWHIYCKIDHSEDRFSGQVRCNGTVTIKSLDGQIIGTVSQQDYKQDFSSKLGAPYNFQGVSVNKQLVQSASNQVVADLSDQVIPKIKAAVEIELSSRQLISQAESSANANQYDNAISTLKQVSPDSVHFQATQLTIKQYEIEKQALILVNSAKSKAKSGQYNSAILLLKDVDIKSKRYKLSTRLISDYRRLLALHHTKTKSLTNTHKPSYKGSLL